MEITKEEIETAKQVTGADAQTLFTAGEFGRYKRVCEVLREMFCSGYRLNIGNLQFVFAHNEWNRFNPRQSVWIREETWGV